MAENLRPGTAAVGSQHSTTRKAASVGAVLTFLAAVSLSCTKSEELVVHGLAPSALAEAASQVDSGRFEIEVQSDAMGAATVEGSWDGDNYEDATEFEYIGSMFDDEDSQGIAVDGETLRSETIRVDRQTYVKGDSFLPQATDGDRWTRMPDDMPIEDTYSPGQVFDDALDVMRDLVVESPAEEVELDGRTLLRQEVTLEGEQAAAALESMDMSTTSYDESLRGKAVSDYVDEHTRLSIVADLDQAGALVQATLQSTSDLDEFPDCEPMQWNQGEWTLVLGSLNEPQQIEPPPAELVDEYELPDLEEMMSELPEDIAGELPDEFADGSPEDFDWNPTLQTAAGERDRYLVIDELIEWAEERDIAWTEIPPPDDETLVLWWNVFWAQELETRGPAILTPDGPYSRGDVVDAVVFYADFLEVDPATIESIPDVELAALARQLIEEGLYLNPGRFDPDFTAEDGYGFDELDDLDPEYDSFEDEIYEGCPS